jgi:uncharacterized protein YbjQ (UPF0145 family)
VPISTTEEPDGGEIPESLDAVSAHVAAGPNVFSDIAASFSDVVGGRSPPSSRRRAEGGS